MPDSIPPAPDPGAWSTRQVRADSHWRRVRRQIEDEQLLHPWRGAYCAPDVGVLTRLRALGLAVGVPVIACHQTAAALHGFGVLDDGLLHVTTPDGRSLRHRSGVRLHQWVPRAPTVEIGGITVTTAADTAVDVAASAREIDILPVLDAASTRCCPDELDDAVGRAKGRRGIAAVRRWRDYADPRAQSPMESRARFRIISAGLPVPDLQIWVPVPPDDRWIDMGWAEVKVGLEYDGEDFHTGDGRLGRDRRRHNQLTHAGWTLVYATAADIYRHPDPLVGHIRTLLGRAA